MPEETSPLGFEQPIEQSFQPKLEEKINFQKRFNDLNTPLGQKIQTDFQERFGDVFSMDKGFRGASAKVGASLSSFQEGDFSLSEEQRQNPFETTPFLKGLKESFGKQFSDFNTLNSNFDQRRGLSNLEVNQNENLSQKRFKDRNPLSIESGDSFGGLVGQGNDLTFTRILGGTDTDRDADLVGTFFQFQQTNVISSALNRNNRVDITTQRLDLLTDSSNVKRRIEILAPNELAITASENLQDENKTITGLIFPQASFHPKASARTFTDIEGKRKIIASIGSQNPTTALRGQNIESLLVFGGDISNDQDPYVRVAQQLKSAVLAINQEVRSSFQKEPKEIRQSIADRVNNTLNGSDQSQNFIAINEQFINRMGRTLENLATLSEKNDERVKGTRVYLSFGTINALLKESEEKGDQFSTIRQALHRLLSPNSEIEIKVLTNINSKNDGDTSLMEDMQNLPEDDIQKKHLYHKLVQNSSLVNVPSSQYHDKSFAITKPGIEGERDKLLAYGVGSAQFSEKSINENIELGVFFSGIDQTVAKEDQIFQQQVLDKLQQGVMPPSQRYENLAQLGSSANEFLSEGLSTVRQKSIQKLYERLEDIQSYYGKDKISINRKYNPQERNKDKQLKGLKVTVRDSLGNNSVSLDFTVKKDGIEEIVSISNKDINISGSVFVNRTGVDLNIDVGGKEKTLSPEQSIKLDSIETTASIIGSLARQIDSQSRFLSTDSAFQFMKEQERFNATERVLLRKANEVLSEMNVNPKASLKEVMFYLRDTPLKKEDKRKWLDQFKEQLSEKLTSRGADASMRRAQQELLADSLTNFGLVGTTEDLDIKVLSQGAVSDLVNNLNVIKDKLSPLQPLKYQIVQNSDVGRLMYKTISENAVKELERTFLDSFFGSHETGGSGMQGMARLPVFGAEEDDTTEANRSRLYSVGDTDLAPHAFLNPLSIKHGDLITTSDKPYGGEFFRPISSVSYNREAGIQSLGGLRTVRTIDDNSDRAAVIYDFKKLMEGMSHLSYITRKDIKSSVSDLKYTVGVNLFGMTGQFDKGDIEEQEDDFLLLMPTQKIAQSSQRLKNMIGTRPMKEVNRSVVKKIYSGFPLSSEDVDSDTFNTGQVSAALPRYQFNYFKQVLEEERIALIEEGDSQLSQQALEKEAMVRTTNRLKRETLDDAGSFNRGYVDHARPRLIAVSAGASTLSDFSFNNSKYEAEFSYRSNKRIQFNATEVYDPNQTRSSILRTLKIGTRIFGTQIELRNPNTEFFKDIKSQFQKNIEQSDSELDLQQRYREALRQVRKELDGDLSQFLDISLSNDNLIFKMDRGAYHFDERGRPTRVARVNEQGYLTVGHKGRSTPHGSMSVPINVKVPATSEAYEQGISIVTETTSGALSDGSIKIDMALDTIKLPGSGLRGGHPNIKGGALYLSEEYFNEIATAFSAKYGFDITQYLPKNVTSKKDGSISGVDIYGVYGPGSFKAFNVESGLYILGDESSRKNIRQLKGKDIALALSHLFIDDLTRDQMSMASLISENLEADSPMKASLQIKGKKLSKKIQTYKNLDNNELEFELGGKFSARGQKSIFKDAETSLIGLLAFAEQEASKSSEFKGKTASVLGSELNSLEIGVRSNDDFNQHLVSVRNLVESALKGETEALKTLETRLTGLLDLLENNERYSKKIIDERNQEQLIFDESSPMVRGASLFTYLATTGRQLYQPSFIKGGKGSIYETPDGRIGGDLNERRELAQDLYRLERDKKPESGITQADKTNIEAFIGYTTGYQLKNIFAREREETLTEQTLQEVESILFSAHTQLQNQLFLTQLVKTNPSQSLVATGMRDVGALEYQYIQSYTKSMKREFLHDPSEGEMDVRMAYSILSNIGRSSAFPSIGDDKNLEFLSLNELVDQGDYNDINRIALNLPRLGEKGEESLEQQIAERLLQTRDQTSFDHLLGLTQEVKGSIRRYEESFRSISLEERISDLEVSLQNLNKELDRSGLDRVRVKGLITKETVEELKQSYSDYQSLQTNVLNFGRFLKDQRPELYNSLDMGGVIEDIYDPITGKLKSEDFDEIRDRHISNLKERHERALADSEPSNILNALRAIWGASQSLEKKDDSYKEVSEEINKTKAVLLPQVGFTEDNKMFALDPSLAEPITLLLPGLELLDHLKVEYPGFDDSLLQHIAKAREINYELRKLDKQLAQSDTPLEVTSEEQSLLKQRERLAFKIREGMKQKVTGSLAKEASGDRKSFTGTSFPAMKLFHVKAHEVVVGSRIDSIESPFSPLDDPRYKKIRQLVSKSLMFETSEEKNKLSEEYNQMKEERQSIYDLRKGRTDLYHQLFIKAKKEERYFTLKRRENANLEIYFKVIRIKPAKKKLYNLNKRKKQQLSFFYDLSNQIKSQIGKNYENKKIDVTYPFPYSKLPDYPYSKSPIFLNFFKLLPFSDESIKDSRTPVYKEGKPDLSHPSRQLPPISSKGKNQGTIYREGYGKGYNNSRLLTKNSFFTFDITIQVAQLPVIKGKVYSDLISFKRVKELEKSKNKLERPKPYNENDYLDISSLSTIHIASKKDSYKNINKVLGKGLSLSNLEESINAVYVGSLESSKGVNPERDKLDYILKEYYFQDIFTDLSNRLTDFDREFAISLTSPKKTIKDSVTFESSPIQNIDSFYTFDINPILEIEKQAGFQTFMDIPIERLYQLEKIFDRAYGKNSSQLKEFNRRKEDLKQKRYNFYLSGQNDFLNIIEDTLEKTERYETLRKQRAQQKYAPSIDTLDNLSFILENPKLEIEERLKKVIEEGYIFKEEVLSRNIKESRTELVRIDLGVSIYKEINASKKEVIQDIKLGFGKTLGLLKDLEEIQNKKRFNLESKEIKELDTQTKEVIERLKFEIDIISQQSQSLPLYGTKSYEIQTEFKPDTVDPYYEGDYLHPRREYKEKSELNKLEDNNPWLKILYKDFSLNDSKDLDKRISLSEYLMRGLQGDNKTPLSTGSVSPKLENKIKEVSKSQEPLIEELRKAYPDVLDIQDGKQIEKFSLIQKLLRFKDSFPLGEHSLTFNQFEIIQKLEKEFNLTIIDKTIKEVNNTVQGPRLSLKELIDVYSDKEFIKDSVRKAFSSSIGYYQYEVRKKLGLENSKRLTINHTPNEEKIEALSEVIQNNALLVKEQIDFLNKQIEKEDQIIKHYTFYENFYREQKKYYSDQEDYYRSKKEHYQEKRDIYQNKTPYNNLTDKQKLEVIKSKGYYDQEFDLIESYNISHRTTPFIETYRLENLEKQRIEIEKKQAQIKEEKIPEIKSSKNEFETNFRDFDNFTDYVSDLLADEITNPLNREKIETLFQEIKESKQVWDQVKVFRGGAPHGIHNPLVEGEMVKDVISSEIINERSRQNNSLIQLAHSRAKTAMIMPGFGSHYVQQGDFDGDTYMLMLSKGRHIMKKQNKLLEEQYRQKNEFQRIQIQKQNLEFKRFKESSKGILSIENSNLTFNEGFREISSIKRNYPLLDQINREMSELETKQRQLDQNREQTQEEIEKNEEELNFIHTQQAKRVGIRQESLKRSIRDWTHHYTGLPNFIFTEEKEGERVTSTLGEAIYYLEGDRGEREEVFTESELSLFMNSMRSVTEMTTAARTGSQAVVETREAFRKANQSIEGNSSLSFKQLDPYFEDDSSVREVVEQLMSQEDLMRLDRQKQETELTQRVSQFYQVEVAREMQEKTLSSASGTLMDDVTQEILQGTIGTSGGQLLGEAYNAFVPMMHHASAQMGFLRSIQDKTDFDNLRDTYIQKLQELSLDETEIDQSVEKMFGRGEEGQQTLIGNLEGHFQSVFQILTNAQIIVRDDALKPKGNSDIVETIREYVETKQINAKPRSRGANIKRQKEISGIVFSNLGTPLNLTEATDYDTGTLGVMRLASMYMGTSDSGLLQTIHGHMGTGDIKGGEKHTFLEDALKVYKNNQGFSDSEEVEINNYEEALRFFEDALVEFTGRTVASFQMNTNLGLSKRELDDLVKKTYAKALDIVNRDNSSHRDRASAERTLKSIENDIRRRYGDQIDREAPVGMNYLKSLLSQDEEASKEILGQLVYGEFVESGRAESIKESFRQARQMTIAADTLRQSENPDQALAQSFENAQQMIALHSVNQRGHLETSEQHHKISHLALKEVQGWAQNISQQGLNVNQLLSDPNRSTDELMNARANLVYGLVSGFGMGKEPASEKEKMAFVASLFEGYSSNPEEDKSHFGKMVSYSQGVEEQLKHIDSLIQLEQRLQATSDRDEVEKIESQYQKHLQAMEGIQNSSQDQTRQQTIEQIGRRSLVDWEEMKENIARKSDPRYTTERDRYLSQVKRQQQKMNKAQQIGQESELIGGLLAPTFLALFNSGINMDEKTAFFAYDVLQSVAETSSFGIRDTNYTLQTQQHLVGGDQNLTVAAKAFRAQRVRQAMETQESFSAGISGAIAQEASIKAFTKAIQGTSRRLNESIGKGRAGANLASMGIELLGDSVMMGVGRLLGGIKPVTPRNQPLPQQMVNYLNERYKALNERSQSQMKAVASSDDDISTFIYNEQVDFIARADETYMDKAERGLVVLNGVEESVPFDEESTS